MILCSGKDKGNFLGTFDIRFTYFSIDNNDNGSFNSNGILQLSVTAETVLFESVFATQQC